jgi:hypothetical protein
MPAYQFDTASLRAEIAAAAARMIAEDGADYGTAKRKAAKQILGDGKPGGDILPSNAQVEDEVRLYNELFLAETQPARLLHLRKLALQLMDELAQFLPHLTGAVLNGTAGAHSDIHLHLFCDSAKDVEIYLINRNVNFDVSENLQIGERNKSVETLSFMRQNEGVHLSIFGTDNLRRTFNTIGERRLERADVASLRGLIQDQEQKSL